MRLVAVRFFEQTVDVAEHFARLTGDVLVRVFGDLAGEIDRAIVDGRFGKARADVMTNDCHCVFLIDEW
jgi:hypothetical protein